MENNMKQSMEVLLDGYAVCGVEEEDFKNTLANISDITRDFVGKATDMVFLSLCRLPSVQEEGKLKFYVLSEDNLEHMRLQGTKLQVQSIPEDRLAPELVEELKETNEILVLVNGYLYFLSNLAITTLMARTGVTGDSTVQRPNLFRDMHLADGAFARNEKIHFVYREINQMRKIFACLGGAYKMVPQTILMDIVDKFREDGIIGRIDVHDWTIDHSWTRIYIDFPDMAEDFAAAYNLPERIIPGLLLQTSDIGLCSVTIRSTYRIGRSYVVAEEVTQKHTLSADADEINERVEKEIFATIRKLPETLMELLGRYTYGDAATDLSDPAEAKKNAQATEQIIKSVMKSVVQPVLTAKFTRPLTEALILEINPEAHYTMYDIAVTFMGIAERLSGASKTTLEKLRKTCATIPYVLEKMKPEGLEAELILLPE